MEDDEPLFVIGCHAMCTGQSSTSVLQNWTKSADGSRIYRLLRARFLDATGCTEIALCLTALLSLQRLSRPPDPNSECQFSRHPLADLHEFLLSYDSFGNRQGTLESIIWSFCRVVPSLEIGEPAYILQFVSYAVDTESSLPPRLDGILDHYLWIRLHSSAHKEALSQCLGDLSLMCSLIAGMHGGANGRSTYDSAPKPVDESSINELASELSSWEVVEARRFKNGLAATRNL